MIGTSRPKRQRQRHCKRQRHKKRQRQTSIKKRQRHVKFLKRQLNVKFIQFFFSRTQHDRLLNVIDV